MGRGWLCHLNSNLKRHLIDHCGGGAVTHPHPQLHLPAALYTYSLQLSLHSTLALPLGHRPSAALRGGREARPPAVSIPRPSDPGDAAPARLRGACLGQVANPCLGPSLSRHPTDPSDLPLPIAPAEVSRDIHVPNVARYMPNWAMQDVRDEVEGPLHGGVAPIGVVLQGKVPLPFYSTLGQERGDLVGGEAERRKGKVGQD